MSGIKERPASMLVYMLVEAVVIAAFLWFLVSAASVTNRTVANPLQHQGSPP